jgi:hypothetical protein
MKKPFIIAAAAFICAGIFLQEAKAQEAVYNEDTVADNVARIDILMKDLDANKADIQKLALEIPYHERAALYKKGKTDALPSVALNAFFFLSAFRRIWASALLYSTIRQAVLSTSARGLRESAVSLRA